MPKPKVSKRTERVQVYLHPGVEQDRIVIDVWYAFGMEGRASAQMAAVMRAGIKAMFEAGDLPQSVVERCRLDERLAPRRTPAPAFAPAGYGVPPEQRTIPYDLPHHQRTRAPQHAPMHEEYADRPVIDQQDAPPARRPAEEPQKPAPAPQPERPKPVVRADDPGPGIPKSKLLNLM